MYTAVCNRVAEAIDEVFNLVRRDRDQSGRDEAMYYFRGERMNHCPKRSALPPEYPALPYVVHDDAYTRQEHEIFNEAVRIYPQAFTEDQTTFEKLARMEHYELPTRLLDVTPKLMTAMAMTYLKGYDGADVEDCHGFLRVYRVAKRKVKYSTSDTVVALSNLARIKPERVTLEDLSYLAAECKNERAGFVWDWDPDTGELGGLARELVRDIGKVWCVRPVMSNVRINAQMGEFFLFGCGNGKSKLDVTFSESDYFNPNAATEGIAQIGIITITPILKKELKEMNVVLDITEDRIYPDFSRFNKVIRERFGRK